MQTGTAQQVVALLQAAGALTPEAAAQALVQEQYTDGTLLQTLITSGVLSFADLQEVLLLYGQLADGDALAEGERLGLTLDEGDPISQFTSTMIDANAESESPPHVIVVPVNPLLR